MKKQLKFLLFGLMILLAAGLTACNSQPDMDGATAFGEAFLGTMSAGEYAAGVAMFHPTFVERIGISVEQLLVVMPPATFHSFDYVADFHELTDVDDSTYTVVRMDGTLTSKIGTPLHLVLDVVAGDAGFAIDGWVIEVAEVDHADIKNATQFVMLSLYLSDFEELANWSAESVSLEGAEAAFPPAFLDRFDVLTPMGLAALNESTGMLPVKVVDVVIAETSQSVRVALFWTRVDEVWKLQGVYSCPTGAFGGVCEIDRAGAGE